MTKFIKSHEELNELPFLIVFRTMQILNEKGMLVQGGEADVGETERKSEE